MTNAKSQELQPRLLHPVLPAQIKVAVVGEGHVRMQGNMRRQTGAQSISSKVAVVGEGHVVLERYPCSLLHSGLMATMQTNGSLLMLQFSLTRSNQLLLFSVVC